MTEFSARVLDWYDRHGRRDLPWHSPRTPYRVWVSEIMLQQTQVATVIPYYQRFMAAFPDLGSLAAATEDEVLGHWSGLGYYARGRNLLAAARRAFDEHDGELPADLEQLMDLPGIGRSTAAAILAQAHGQPQAILDGNVKRLLSRYFAVEGWPGTTAAQKLLWAHSEALLPEKRLPDYTQAIMDLGSMLCRRSRPLCDACPLTLDCQAFVSGRTGELPAPRPKRERPLRHARMLVLRDSAGRLLLEKQPSPGIWGGLWSLPDSETVIEHCQRRLGVDVTVSGEAEPFRHAFSHFELEITPVYARAEPLRSYQVATEASPRASVADGNRPETTEGQQSAPLQSMWLAAGDDLPALPSPIRRLIDSLPGFSPVL